MQRWILKDGTTSLDGLVLEDASKPVAGPGEVLIRVRAVSLNFRDQIVVSDPHWRAEGHNLVPVSDGSGEVEAVGEGVARFAPGDRVVGLMFKNWVDGPPRQDIGMGLGSLTDDGMLAEYVVLPETGVAPMPKTLDFAEAATLPCAGVTAYHAVMESAPPSAGTKVLTLGSGGVAIFAMQIAGAVGAELIAISSSDEKLERLQTLGAVITINYKSRPDWGMAVLEATHGGVDKVIDSVGDFNQSLMAVRPYGEIAAMGLMAQGEALNPALFMGKCASMRGVLVGNAQHYAKLAELIDAHGIKPVIDDAFRFDFADAKSAYQAQSSPDIFGKIVIQLP